MPDDLRCANGHLVASEEHTLFCPFCGVRVGGGGTRGFLSGLSTTQAAVTALGLGGIAGAAALLAFALLGGDGDSPAGGSSGILAGGGDGSPAGSGTGTASTPRQTLSAGTRGAATSAPSPASSPTGSETGTAGGDTTAQTASPPPAPTPTRTATATSTTTPAPPPAATATSTATPTPTATDTPIPTATATPSSTATPTPSATPVPPAAFYGVVYLDVFGDITTCDLCEFIVDGPEGAYRITPQLGTAAFAVRLPPGAYDVYYVCPNNFPPPEELWVPNSSPSQLILAPGFNQQDVTVGVCY